MLNMKVEDYRITSDTNGITVNRVKRDEENNITMSINRYTKEEEESVDLVGYYPTIEVATRGIIRHYTNSDLSGELTTLKEFEEAVRHITEAFNSALPTTEV